MKSANFCVKKERKKEKDREMPICLRSDRLKRIRVTLGKRSIRNSARHPRSRLAAARRRLSFSLSLSLSILLSWMRGAETIVALFEEGNGVGEDVRGHSRFLIGERNSSRFWRVASSHATAPRRGGNLACNALRQTQIYRSMHRICDTRARARACVCARARARVYVRART